MVADEAVEATPEVASDHDSAYIRGIAKLSEELVVLLDLRALFADQIAASAAVVA
jgi:chemotaxis signal transduction protein